MTATCCARGRPRRCSGTGWRRRRRWGRSCARSRSGTSASSTASSAWRLSGRGRRAPAPAIGRLVVDVDSFVGEVHGYKKQGAAFGYTRKLGYHPILATRADTGEVLHIRLRKGSANTSRGMLRFFDELIARVDRAGATGPKLLRADSGFWDKKTFARLHWAGWQFSIGVRMQPHVRAAIEAIAETAWSTLTDYPKTSIAQIAETRLGAVPAGRPPRPARSSRRASCCPTWEHYAFVTNRTDALHVVEAEHRQHAVVELAIRDLKDQALAHFPSGNYNANAAWTVIAALAHNLLRWTQTDRPARQPRSAPPAPSAGGCSRSPADSPAAAAGRCCGCPPAGPGRPDFLTALDHDPRAATTRLSARQSRRPAARPPASACPRRPQTAHRDDLNLPTTASNSPSRRPEPAPEPATRYSNLLTRPQRTAEPTESGHNATNPDQTVDRG